MTYHERANEWRRVHIQQRRDAFRAAGLCIECGGERDSNRTLCATCRRKMADWQKAWRMRQVLKELNLNVCTD